jgi:hypothetical protein
MEVGLENKKKEEDILIRDLHEQELIKSNSTAGVAGLCNGQTGRPSYE